MIPVTDSQQRLRWFDAPPGLRSRAFDAPRRKARRSTPKQSAVQRWQAAKLLHKTGVVSRVPRSARSAQAGETDSNTDLKRNIHRSSACERKPAAKRKEAQRDSSRAPHGNDDERPETRRDGKP